MEADWPHGDEATFSTRRNTCLPITPSRNPTTWLVFHQCSCHECFLVIGPLILFLANQTRGRLLAVALSRSGMAGCCSQGRAIVENLYRVGP